MELEDVKALVGYYQPLYFDHYALFQAVFGPEEGAVVRATAVRDSLKRVERPPTTKRVTPAGVETHDYMHQFSEQAVAGMRRLRLRFAEQCQAHHGGGGGSSGGGDSGGSGGGDSGGSGGGGVCEADDGSNGGGSGAAPSSTHACASPAAVRPSSRRRVFVSTRVKNKAIQEKCSPGK